MVIFCAALALLLFLGVIAYLITSDGKKTIKKQKTSQKQHVAEKTKKFDTDLDKMIIAASDVKLTDIELKELAKLYVQTHNVGGKIKCRKRKIKCRIFATNYLSFNLKLKL
ncbi:hypothetical protein FI332_02960 [Campylobacter jejuni]|nr:hypothetical protein [Campylobacter jejuni]